MDSTPSHAAVRTPADLGALVRQTRKDLRMTQADLAKAAGTGIRFLVDLESGKVTCQVGKILHVLAILGVTLRATRVSGPNGETTPAAPDRTSASPTAGN